LENHPREVRSGNLIHQSGEKPLITKKKKEEERCFSRREGK